LFVQHLNASPVTTSTTRAARKKQVTEAPSTSSTFYEASAMFNLDDSINRKRFRVFVFAFFNESRRRLSGKKKKNLSTIKIVFFPPRSWLLSGVVVLSAVRW
jgi:hypothetical protein